MNDKTASTPRARYWAVIPAAGTGSRMDSDMPKQYMKLAGRTVIEHTLHRIAMHPLIAEIVVVTSEEDQYWQGLHFDWVAKPIHRVKGGAERCYSVFNALEFLKMRIENNDWVLVHDAARPCVRPGDIDNLITQVGKKHIGGILGVRVNDTMKRSNDDQVIMQTVDRNNLWHALTPQLFRFDLLYQTLKETLSKGVEVTDEAMAIEAAGHQPLLVEGHTDNIKITRPEDLGLAAYFLRQQTLTGIGVFHDGMDDGG
jgi:2-C-methyl-D-erythritol 4-phosphate cytidylyltransferase